jgi:uncharacterized DUF497 family protein
MELTPDPTFKRWLETWPGDFEWDTANIVKLLKHATSQWEIESIFAQDYFFLGRISEPPGNRWNEARFLLLGQSISGRAFALICTPRKFALRMISCRPQRLNEKKAFAQLMESNNAQRKDDELAVQWR